MLVPISTILTRAIFVAACAELQQSSSIGSNGYGAIVAPRSRESFAVLLGGAVRRLTGDQSGAAVQRRRKEYCHGIRAADYDRGE